MLIISAPPSTTGSRSPIASRAAGIPATSSGERIVFVISSGVPITMLSSISLGSSAAESIIAVASVLTGAESASARFVRRVVIASSVKGVSALATTSEGKLTRTSSSTSSSTSVSRPSSTS